MSARRNQVINFWKRDNRCHWCKCTTVLILRPHDMNKGVDKILPHPREATIDHLRSRFHPDRHEPNPALEYRRVLACWKCNNMRGIEEQRAIPIDIIRKKSNAFPLGSREALEKVRLQRIQEGE